jgi:hypothetical protein
VNGVATYTAATDDNVAIPGTYTLTASGGAGVVAGFRPAVVETNPFLAGVSRTFAIDGFQLAVKGPPTKVGVNTFLPMVVGLFDKKHKLVTADDGFFVDVSQATQIEGTHSTDNAFYIVQPEPLEGGIATFTVDQGLIFKDVGTFALRVTEYSSLNEDGDPTNPVSVTNDGLSKPFQVMPDHLIFTEEPSFEFVNEPIIFQVEVEDYKNKVVTSEDGNLVKIAQVVSLTGPVETNLPERAIIIEGGIANFSAAAEITIDTAGTYEFGVEEIMAVSGNPSDDIVVTTTLHQGSKLFRISAG